MWAALLLLSSLVSGQTLPNEIRDTETAENLEYLHQEIRKLRTETGVTADGDNTWTGSNNWAAATMVGGGLLRQYVSSTTAAPFAPVHSAIPADNTAPEITEGMQVLVATITPVSASSKLEVEAIIQYGESSNNCNSGAVCIFQDAGASSIACASIDMNGTPYASAALKYVVAAVSTTQRNYSVRIGCEVANTVEVNRQGNALRYGSTLTSSLTIKEIAQ